MTTPIQRISRLINEGAKFMVELPGQMSIDLTPDVIAAMDEVQTVSNPDSKARNLFNAEDKGRDVPTRVQFP